MKTGFMRRPYVNGWHRKMRDSGDDPRLALIALFPAPWQADIAVSLLVSEGIRAFPADDRRKGKPGQFAGNGESWVVVPEIEAPLALGILEMAERGDLSLPEEAPGSTDEWNRRKAEVRKAIPRRGQPGTDARVPGTDSLFLVRCPRCGSANISRTMGIRILFSPRYRCKVCHWRWRKKTDRLPGGTP